MAFGKLDSCYACLHIQYSNSCSIDLMYLNGESLLRMSFRERQSRLQDSFVPKQGVFDFAEGIQARGVPDDQEKVYAFFDKSIREGNEGMMVKVLDPPPPGVQQPLSTYEPGMHWGWIFYQCAYLILISSQDKRVESWLKVKKDYLEGVGDSLDLVVSLLLFQHVNVIYNAIICSPLVHGMETEGRPAGIHLCSWRASIQRTIHSKVFANACQVCVTMQQVSLTNDLVAYVRLIVGFSDEFYRNMKQFYSGDRTLEHARHDYVTDMVPDGW